MNKGNRSLFILFWLFVSSVGVNGFFLFAKQTAKTDSTRLPVSNRAAMEKESKRRNEKNAKQVILDRAETLSFNHQRNPDAQLLKGDVVFQHDGMTMYCDSAYFYDKSNSFEAFSNIKMEQGDTLFVYGDYLFYDGNTKLARLRNNVKLENRDLTLLTDSLNYNRLLDMGYYFEGGMLIDPDNELKSWYGEYSPTTKLAHFVDHVVLTNEKFVLTTDTLNYNTHNRVADLVCPSVIKSDSGTIFSSNGWYDTRLQESLLLDRSVIVSKKQQHITGDSIYYFRNTGIARVHGNMFSIDTTRKVIITGDYGYMNDSTDYTFATRHALLKEFSGTDTLFMHADTLSAEQDSTFRIMRGINNVRFFRGESQGVCGNFRYVQRDSAVYMNINPVLWNNSYQITGDEIITYMNDSTIDWAHVIGNSFAIEQLDSLCYNQLFGKELKAFFKEGDIHQVDVSGNVLTIFFPQEADSTLIGLNQTESSFLKMFLLNNKMDKLILWPSPKASLTPMPLTKKEQFFLQGFRWLDYLRPKDKDDVFREVNIKKEDVQAVRKRRVKAD